MLIDEFRGLTIPIPFWIVKDEIYILSRNLCSLSLFHNCFQYEISQIKLN